MNSRKNYTEREKIELLTIVDKYKTIIENKSTNAVTTEKKNMAWGEITDVFNASADNPRTAKQLSMAYQNLKRQARRTVADDNMQSYINSQIALKQFKKDDAEDKKALKATGGGSYTPVLTELGAQMLAIMGNQLTPLSNSCDSAAGYYEISNNNKNLEDRDTFIECPVVIEFTSPPIIEQNKPAQEENNNNILEPGEPVQNVIPKRQDYCSQAKKRRRQVQLKKNKKNVNANLIKKRFYQKKLESAIIEHKTNMVNYKIALKQMKLINLELKIKNEQFQSKQQI